MAYRPIGKATAFLPPVFAPVLAKDAGDVTLIAHALCMFAFGDSHHSENSIPRR